MVRYLRKQDGSALVGEIADALARYERRQGARKASKGATRGISREEIEATLVATHLPELAAADIVDVDDATATLTDDVAARIVDRLDDGVVEPDGPAGPDCAETTSHETDGGPASSADGTSSDCGSSDAASSNGGSTVDVRSSASTREWYTREQARSLADAIVDAIEEHRGDRLLRTDFQLYEDVDARALEELFREDAGPGTRVAFATDALRVELWCEEGVHVRVSDAGTSP